MNFSDKIIKLRSHKEWSQSELARRCGLTSSAICLLEKGGVNPTLKSLNKISKAFGINIQELTENKLKVNDFNIFMNKFNHLSAKDKQIVEKLIDYFISAKKGS